MFHSLLSTVIYPELSTKMAMKIGKRYESEKVFLRHWHRIVPDTIAAKKALEKELMRLSKECLEQVDDLKISLAGEGVKSAIFDDICAVIKKRVEYIQR